MLRDQIKQLIINQVEIFRPFSLKGNVQHKRREFKAETHASQKDQSQGNMVTPLTRHNKQKNKPRIEFRNSMLLTRFDLPKEEKSKRRKTLAFEHKREANLP